MAVCRDGALRRPTGLLPATIKEPRDLGARAQAPSRAPRSHRARDLRLREEVVPSMAFQCLWTLPCAMREVARELGSPDSLQQCEAR